MRRTFFSLTSLAGRFQPWSNGQQVIQAIEKILSKSNLEETKQPVSLVILDINMPILDGIQTSKRIKQMYNELNNQSDLSGTNSDREKNPGSIVRPFICHLT